ncbi:hypothetical protein [Xanthobacter agilis]|jgi:hypothetical protein|uniref:hypothetical protein n=1 Tax=Xanthobacter agilis TaxID=47492 RepID=UPI001F471978|nr:hypothetical protein [Xanthobacter agilis]
MVTFAHPFWMSSADGTLPAGTYRVAIDEEQLLGLSFVAYRRVATMLQTPAVSAPPGRSTSLSIDPVELDAALLRDRQETAGHADVSSAISFAERGAFI